MKFPPCRSSVDLNMLNSQGDIADGLPTTVYKPPTGGAGGVKVDSVTGAADRQKEMSASGEKMLPRTALETWRMMRRVRGSTRCFYGEMAAAT